MIGVKKIEKNHYPFIIYFLCDFDCCLRIVFGVGHFGNRFVFFVMEISSLRNQIFILHFKK